MKKNSSRKSIHQFNDQQLNQAQSQAIKGGTGDTNDDIVVIDIISI